jgi:hypothetical protein
VWNTDLQLAELVDPLSVDDHVGCTLDPVFGKLLRRRMVSMNAAASLFYKVSPLSSCGFAPTDSLYSPVPLTTTGLRGTRWQYGCDKAGLLPYDLFINGLCSAPARLLGMERILNTRESGANGLTVRKGALCDGRVLYPKCKNAVFPATDFMPQNVLRSDCPPKASLQLEHVYGYAGKDNAAPNIFFLQSGEGAKVPHALRYGSGVGASLRGCLSVAAWAGVHQWCTTPRRWGWCSVRSNGAPSSRRRSVPPPPPPRAKKKA